MLKINLDPDRAHRIDDELLGVALMSVDLDLPSQTPPLSMRGIDKRFNAVPALLDVTVSAFGQSDSPQADASEQSAILRS